MKQSEVNQIDSFDQESQAVGNRSNKKKKIIIISAVVLAILIAIGSAAAIVYNVNRSKFIEEIEAEIDEVYSLDRPLSKNSIEKAKELWKKWYNRDINVKVKDIKNFEKLEELTEEVRIYNGTVSVQKAAISKAEEALKQRLLNPQSYNPKEIDIDIFRKEHSEWNSTAYICVNISYTAQNKLGGYSADNYKVYYESDFPILDNLDELSENFYIGEISESEYILGLVGAEKSPYTE